MFAKKFYFLWKKNPWHFTRQIAFSRNRLAWNYRSRKWTFLVHRKIPLQTILTGKSLLSMGKMGKKYLDSGNETYILLIWLFKSFNMSPGLSSWEHRKLECRQKGKIGTTGFLEKAIWRVNWRYWGDFSGILRRKKTETFAVDVIGSLLKDASSTSQFLSLMFLFYFDTLSCFAIKGWKVLKCWKLGHAWSLDNFTREIALINKYLTQFSQDRKVLWITLI